MPPILDTLFVDDANFDFVVNTAVNEVNLNLPQVPPATYGNFQNGSTFDRLDVQDPFNCLCVGIRLPFCFTIGTGVPYFATVWLDSVTAGVTIISQLSPPGRLAVYEPDVEICIDVNIPWPAGPLAVNPFHLAIGEADLNISMVGVPAALNGLTFRAFPFMRIHHNLNMLA